MQNTMNSLVKICFVMFACIQVVSAFVSTVPSNAIPIQLNAEVVGIGGLGGIEVVGIDKYKAKAAGKASEPKATPKKKAGGSKLPGLKK